MKSNQTPEKLFSNLFAELQKEFPQIEDKIISIAESGFDIKEFAIYLNKSNLTDEQKNEVSKNFSTLVIKNLIKYLNDYSKFSSINFKGDVKKQKLEMLKGLSDLQFPLAMLKSLNDPLSILLENLSRFLNNQLSLITKYEVENKPEEKEKETVTDSHKINWLLTFQDFAYLIHQLKSNGYIKDTYENIAKHFLIKGDEINPINLKNTISNLNNPNTDNRPSESIKAVTSKIK